MNKNWLCLALLVLGQLCVSCASSETSSRSAVKLAKATHGRVSCLVIGQDEYANMGSLASSGQDLIHIERVVKEYCGMISPMPKTAKPYSKNEFNDVLKEVKSRCGRNGVDSIMIFYSGHGVQIEDDLYLVPRGVSELEKNTIKKEGIALREVVSDVIFGLSGHVKKYLFVINACRNEMGEKSKFPIKSMFNKKHSNLNEEFCIDEDARAELRKHASTLHIVFSTVSNEQSWTMANVASPTAFTRYFCNAIKNSPGQDVGYIIQQTKNSLRKDGRGLRPVSYSEDVEEFVLQPSSINESHLKHWRESTYYDEDPLEPDRSVSRQGRFRRMTSKLNLKWYDPIKSGLYKNGLACSPLDLEKVINTLDIFSEKYANKNPDVTINSEVARLSEQLNLSSDVCWSICEFVVPGIKTMAVSEEVAVLPTEVVSVASSNSEAKVEAVLP